MAIPNPESAPKQQDCAKKKQIRDKKMFLLSTKHVDVRKLNAEIEKLEMEIFELLYGDNE